MRTHTAMAALALLAAFLAVPSARATPPLLLASKRAGLPAEGCQYCHTFDTRHMVERARRLGLSNMDCGACHGARLPKSGLALFNDRGRWLVGQKRLRRADKVDVGWLRAYKAP
jgi:hypothetical protein